MEFLLFRNIRSSPRLHSWSFIVSHDLCDTHFSPGTKILLYADDISLYKPISGPEDTTSFQEDINLLSNWVADNRLALNPLKTKFMFISRSRSFNFPPLLLNGSKLEKVSHFKYIGVWISDDLSWSKHIESICSKSCRTLGYIFRTFSPCCEPEAVLSLYKSQVLPVLEYACVVWNPHLKKDQLLLQSVQL